MPRQALKSMVDEANWWYNITGKGKFIDINNLTQEDANSIFRKIDCGLSPENLHCDGEISHEQAMERYKVLIEAAVALKSMGFTVPKDTCELGV